MLTQKTQGRSTSAALSLAFKSKLFLLLSTVLFLIAPFLSAQGTGIGSYDLKSTADLSFAFDYNSSGLADHLVLYRPGTGIVYILANPAHDGNFVTVYASGSGIGSYDLRSPADRIFAFDYDGSGKSDHLVCYRPGTGIIFILANMGGTFTPVYEGSDGVGGYDLRSTNDQLMAFDYDGSGLSDHLVAYRPGSGVISIIGNTKGTFAPVLQSSTGIGGYDLSATSDAVIAFDYRGYGSADHLLMYRPGTGMVYILENAGGSYSPVYQSTSGIGTYDLKSPNDKIIAYDFTGTGSKDHLLLYRPGSGIAFILQSAFLDFTPVYQSGANLGIGSYDLRSSADLITTFDFMGTGINSDLFLYRPGAGVGYILGNNNGVFTTLFQ